MPVPCRSKCFCPGNGSPHDRRSLDHRQCIIWRLSFKGVTDQVWNANFTSTGYYDLDLGSGPSV